MAFSPLEIEQRNSRAFILFRILFNCRLYYPIFTILFLDYGLSLEQFSLLNVVWALSIVFFEVPSGALADIVGRKRLVVFAAFLMILEMAVILFSPRMSPLVFWLFLVNRILSGLAEASASGADEALTYDSLTGDKESKWTLLLARSMKYQSVFMVVAMLLGAFLYDWNLIRKIFPFWENIFTRDISLRVPIALNFLTAVFCFVYSTKFIDDAEGKFTLSTLKNSVLESFKQILVVAKYIYSSRRIFSLIIVGLVLDSSLRMFITLISKYYRNLGIPESLYGVIGAAMAFVGIISSSLGLRFVNKFGVRVNFGILCATTLGVFLGILYWHSIWALVLIFIFALAMYLLGFFMSHYINLAAPSKMRATLLSFKGLAFNLAYGWVGVLYAGVAAKSNDSFDATLPFFYKYFLIMLVLGFVVQFVHGKFTRAKVSG
jgi:hypothetical protein